MNGPNPLDPILKNRRVIITCGTGGVGKTTVSAAIALRSAELGYRTLVITIDPAKRLSQALGIDAIGQKVGDHPYDLTALLSAALGQAPKGTCFALMPDTRATFEGFIRQIAPTPETAERIMRNPIYQVFAKEFSGTNEYMAMERLLSVSTSSHYDRVILDTPPSRNTLDFLDAPGLLTRFFEERFVRWLAVPASKSIFSGGIKKILGLLEQLTGSGFTSHLFEFANGMLEVQKGFVENLDAIMKLLKAPTTGFVLVSAPSQEVTRDAEAFIDSVRGYGFVFDGVILNRTYGHLRMTTEDTRADPALAAQPAYIEARAIIGALQAREKTVLHQLENEDLPFIARLPQLSRDVHSVEDLVYVAHAAQLPNQPT